MRQKGFTIPELLIVIAVIGILVSMAVVSYAGVTNRGYDAAVQSDLDATAGLLESYRVNPNNPSEFPHDTTALATLGIKATKKSYLTTGAVNFLYCTTANFQSFALVARSKSNNFFMVTEDGLKPYTLGAGVFTAAALCPALSMTLVSSGMSAPNTWQTWVGGT